MTYRKIILIAALSGAIAVIVGAFGAHALANKISETQLSSFKTGNTYQFYHSLYLIVIGILYKFEPSKKLRYAFWTGLFGIICFSGSLYILGCRDLMGLKSTAIIGPITPLGGLLFVISWVLVALNYLGKENE